MAISADSARSKRKSDAVALDRTIINGQTAFLGSALIGSALVFLGEPFNSPYLMGVFGPMAIMLVYMGLGLADYLEIADDESFADSIYYLGFLLTLISLAAALVYLRNDNLQLGLLVSKFGLALLTTIIGLCVRVALVSFKVASNEAKKAADERLSRAIERFTTDIETTCDKIEILLNGSLDQVTTTAAEVSRATTEATKTMQAEMVRTSQHIKTLHEDSEKQWKQTIESLSSSLDQVISNATEFSIDRLKALNAKIHSEMDAFHIPPEIVISKLDPALNDLQRGIGGFVANVDQLANASTGHEELRIQFENLGTALSSGTETVNTLRTKAKSLIDSYENLDLLGQRFENLHVQLDRASDSMDQWGTTVDDSIDLLSTGAKAGRLSIDALAQEVRDLVSMSQEQSETISQVVSEMTSDAKEGQRALMMVQKNLVDSSRVIVDQLKQ